MRVLSITRGQDTAGQGIGLKRAFARYAPEVTFHSVVGNTNYIEYPPDVLWDGIDPIAHELYEAADVVHLHNGITSIRRIDPRHRKPAIDHHHGSAFRRTPGAYLADDRRIGALSVCSTIDMTRYSEALHWLPQTVDEPRMQAIAEEHRRPADGKIRIGHAPTNRPIKSTELFLEAMGRLRARYPHVQLELIERVPHAACLERKATVDIFYDQVGLGYGNNAIEAWVMGIPVVAGADDWTLAAMQERFGELPFYRATERTLEARLEELILEPELRTEYAARGLRHVERFHHQRQAVARALELYTEAIEGRRGRLSA